MSAPPDRPRVPAVVLAILGACGGCLLVTVILGVVVVNLAMKSAPVALIRAKVLRDQKRYPESEAMLLQALKHSPRSPILLNDLAWTYYLDHKYAEGEPYAVRAVAARPNGRNLDTLAHIHLGMKRYDAAEKEFTHVLRLRPDSAASLAGLGEVYEAEGRRDKALAEYQKAANIDPSIEGLQGRIRRLEPAGPKGKATTPEKSAAE
jgi:tetratricopeptide (TPR) repeat protein